MIFWGIGLFAAAVLGGWMVREAFAERLHEEDIVLDRLPASFDGSRIFFISDVHRRIIKRSLIDRVKAAGGADLVLIGGDLRERGVPLARSRANIRLLAELGPVYMVFGNHDYDTGAREFDVMLQEERVTVLGNSSVTLEQRDGSVIRLAGIDDLSRDRHDLNAALARPEDGPASAEPSCTILLAHDPLLFEEMTPDQAKQIDLVLCGHTHGGQIVLPLIGPLIRGYVYYLSGWCRLPEHTAAGDDHHPRLFVSNGYGTSHLPLRLSAPAQAHLFTLRRR